VFLWSGLQARKVSVAVFLISTLTKPIASLDVLTFLEYFLEPDLSYQLSRRCVLISPLRSDDAAGQGTAFQWHIRNTGTGSPYCAASEKYATMLGIFFEPSLDIYVSASWTSRRNRDFVHELTNFNETLLKNVLAFHNFQGRRKWSPNSSVL
jgi:hypothetical protein